MRRLRCLLVCLLVLGGLTFSVTAEYNLIRNGDFEDLDGQLPRHWKVDTWLKDPLQSRFSVEQDNPYAGKKYLVIESPVPDDAKLIQNVKVDPKTMYKLSCRIKAENIPAQALGANISVLGLMANSQDLTDTGGEWRYVEFYGKTGPRQEQITVAVRLGGYSSINSGKAAFDDVQMIKVSQAPQGVKVADFWEEPRTDNPSTPVQASTPIATTPGNLLTLLILSLLFAACLMLAYRYLIRNNTGFPSYDKLIENGFYLLLFLAFFLRLALAPVFPGFPNDIACFKGWSNDAFSRGIPDFYLGGGFVDYPPGYIYVLYVIGFIRNLFGLDYSSPVYLTIIKVPPFITELLTAFFIYKIGRRYLKSVAASAAIALFYALNPVVIHNSAVFAQIDSVFSLFMLLTLMFIDRKNIALGSLFYTIAVLIKPQALIFAPVGLGVLIESKNWRTIVLSLATIAGTFILLILPFSLKQSNPLWVFNLYMNTLGSYEFATLNAFNFYALIGANWAQLNSLFLFIPFRIWGLIFMGLLLAFAAFIYTANLLKQKNSTWPLYLALFLITAFYMLVYKMHERYLYPAIILSLLCFVVINDRRFLFIFLGLSITLFFNQEMILHFAVKYNTFNIPQENTLMYNLMRVIGGLNVGLLAYLAKVGCDIYLFGKVVPLVKEGRKPSAAPAQA